MPNSVAPDPLDLPEIAEERAESGGLTGRRVIGGEPVFQASRRLVDVGCERLLASDIALVSPKVTE